MLFEFIGHFHPLVVHLPIGILSLFLVLTVALPRARLYTNREILKISLLVSALSASMAVITGFLLENPDDYDTQLVGAHLILGMCLTMLNWIVWFALDWLLTCPISRYRGILVLLTALMIVTGHLGGSLTHGSEFLSPPPVSQWFSDQENDLVITTNSTGGEMARHILNSRCVSCHGVKKQKGKLRLDSPENISKGGKNGSLLDPEQSLLIHRITLPMEDEDHMPPDGRKQLNKLEVAFLKEWIEKGADFNLALSGMETSSELLATMKLSTLNASEEQDIVAQANTTSILKLQEMGLMIVPISESSNWLEVNFNNVPKEQLGPTVNGLLDISKQIKRLNLDYQELKEEEWKTIGQLENLESLSVRNTNIKDQGLQYLLNLKQLKSLNLVGTSISKEGLMSLDLPSLQKLYLYQTSISKDQISQLEGHFKDVEITIGGYQIPTYASDTTVLTKKDLK